ncbi:neutral/alkaline non-lysosomal ceramidase N-terminal domain-containing protein [Leptospira sp. 96542]|nr:neutral/alkaline non-lysosomal ceramidase N-terminal domain-containing protein [Leptospira sp. 96542]
MKSPILFFVSFLVSLPLLAQSVANYDAGMSKVDITGPPVGVMFWGYAQPEQTGQGIHTRQFVRSLVLKDKKNGNLLAYATAEVGGIPFEIQRDVVARLQKEVNPNFHYANVLLNASHTHSGPAGYFHYSEFSLYSTNFFPGLYNVIVDGIVKSIKQSYDGMAASEILLGKTKVVSGGVNRSLVAYEENPDEERKKYSDNVDTDMIQITVKQNDKIIGFVNWYGIHPTNITFDNRLISTDNKGVASLLSEALAAKEGNPNFVAIYAQANEGDVTPNLNLNNTGPGKDMYESAYILGERQFNAATSILKSEGKPLGEGLKFTQRFINMGNTKVSAKFTGTGKDETTCLSAYGYALAAGSTEEGGGHFLFHEGMTDKDRKFYIDFLARMMLQAPSEELQKCQAPKAVLFPMGETKPIPSLPQILPYGIVTIGELGILVTPHEVTTMSSRRLKQTVRQHLGGAQSEFVLSGLTNDFSGYITTNEEYRIQQYEGGHTLHGPHSLAALRQEFDGMAEELAKDKPKKTQNLEPMDLSKIVKHKPLPEIKSKSKPKGKVLTENKSNYQLGETVNCRVGSSHPNVGYPNISSYFDVEILENESWKVYKNDGDLYTKFQFKPGFLFVSEPSISMFWETNTNDKPGEYRLVHRSVYLDESEKTIPYVVECPSFRLQK